MDKKIYIVEDYDNDWSAHATYAEALMTCLKRYSTFLNDNKEHVSLDEILTDINSLADEGYILDLVYIHTVNDFREN